MGQVVSSMNHHKDDDSNHDDTHDTLLASHSPDLAIDSPELEDSYTMSSDKNSAYTTIQYSKQQHVSLKKDMDSLRSLPGDLNSPILQRQSWSGYYHGVVRLPSLQPDIYHPTSGWLHRRKSNDDLSLQQQLLLTGTALATNNTSLQSATDSSPSDSDNNEDDDDNDDDDDTSGVYRDASTMMIARLDFTRNSHHNNNNLCMEEDSQAATATVSRYPAFSTSITPCNTRPTLPLSLFKNNPLLLLDFKKSFIHPPFSKTQQPWSSYGQQRQLPVAPSSHQLPRHQPSTELTCKPSPSTRLQDTKPGDDAMVIHNKDQPQTTATTEDTIQQTHDDACDIGVAGVSDNNMLNLSNPPPQSRRLSPSPAAAAATTTVTNIPPPTPPTATWQKDMTRLNQSVLASRKKKKKSKKATLLSDESNKDGRPMERWPMDDNGDDGVLNLVAIPPELDDEDISICLFCQYRIFAHDWTVDQRRKKAAAAAGRKRSKDTKPSATYDKRGGGGTSLHH